MTGIGQSRTGHIVGIEIQMIVVQRSQHPGGAKAVTALDPRIGVELEGIRPDKVISISQQLRSSFEDRSSIAGIEKKTRDILRMVPDDQLRRITARQLDAIGLDRVYGLCLRPE